MINLAPVPALSISRLSPMDGLLSEVSTPEKVTGFRTDPLTIASYALLPVPFPPANIPPPCIVLRAGGCWEAPSGTRKQSAPVSSANDMLRVCVRIREPCRRAEGFQRMNRLTPCRRAYGVTRDDSGLVMIHRPTPSRLSWQARIAGSEELGDRLTVAGRVFSPDGRTTAPGVTLRL
jgi:hypothetical protein